MQIEEEKNKRLNLTDEERYKAQLDIDQRRLENIKKLYGEDSLEYQKQLTTIYNLTKEYQDKLNEANNSSSGDTGDTSEAPKEDPIIQQLKDRAAAYEESLLTEAEKLEQRRQLIESYHEQGLIDEQTYQTLLTEYQKDAEEQRISNQTALQERKLSNFNLFANTFQDLCSAITDNLSEEDEKQFEAIKAFQIASATIQTIQGAIGAYMGASSNAGLNAIPVVGPALAIAMGVTNAAIVTASGIANIRKIASQKFNGSGTASSASSASASMSSAATSVTTPQQYSTAVEGAEIESSISDSKVYVVESDIQAVGNKVNVQETENRY